MGLYFRLADTKTEDANRGSIIKTSYDWNITNAFCKCSHSTKPLVKISRESSKKCKGYRVEWTQTMDMKAKALHDKFGSDLHLMVD